MSKKIKAGIAAGVLAVICIGVFVYISQTVKGATKDHKIVQGVVFEGKSLGGMTKEEAKKEIENYIEKEKTKDITFYVDDKKAVTKLSKTGVSWDVEKTVKDAYGVGRSGSIISRYSQVKKDQVEVKIERSYDQETFDKELESAAKKIVSEPKNASLKRKNGKFVIVKEKTGYALNKKSTFQAYKKQVEAESFKVPLKVTRKKAEYTSEDMAKVKDKLGTKTTYYGSSAPGRKGNVANGAKMINGSVVYPGETFSVYKAVSPFTSENGYYLAGSYENGQTVQTYGGGICQVSTTLYNAVIRAELKIKERHPHSMTVSYVPRSADAAIAGTYKDLKFQNQFDFPIYIEGIADGSNITFTVYGQKTNPNRHVEFVSETTSVRNSSGEKVIKDPTMEEGKRVVEQVGHTGYEARLWKIVKEKGKKTKKILFNTSSYMATPNTVRVGTKKKEKDKDKKKDSDKKNKDKKNTEKSTEKTTEKNKTTEKKKEAKKKSTEGTKKSKED
ncbi:VanW family protein [Anaerostipes rhamnosivorans]|jgi:vancomycin resistance protein YoaR|uniref:Vancomycin B-type resistance protein VanW n=1 Tax=Anaerostipes rhamnosivorans TaxID=1229621 RepID=A0A4P8I951_9FIRM|nr:VanW family protein [Anaerostipes rhamnosivorans]QCP33916.1 Vancomycin B-type resistance protein VanW [Anaerostipes rhamnosivorans]